MTGIRKYAPAAPLTSASARLDKVSAASASRRHVDLETLTSERLGPADAAASFTGRDEVWNLQQNGVRAGRMLRLLFHNSLSKGFFQLVGSVSMEYRAEWPLSHQGIPYDQDHSKFHCKSLPCVLVDKNQL